jgi:uncharacterized protein YoxC
MIDVSSLTDLTTIIEVRIVSLLGASETPMRRKDIIEAVKTNGKRFSSAIKNLVGRGFVSEFVKFGVTLYEASAAVRSVPAEVQNVLCKVQSVPSEGQSVSPTVQNVLSEVQIVLHKVQNVLGEVRNVPSEVQNVPSAAHVNLKLTELNVTQQTEENFVKEDSQAKSKPKSKKRPQSALGLLEGEAGQADDSLTNIPNSSAPAAPLPSQSPETGQRATECPPIEKIPVDEFLAQTQSACPGVQTRYRRLYRQMPFLP